MKHFTPDCYDHDDNKLKKFATPTIFEWPKGEEKEEEHPIPLPQPKQTPKFKVTAPTFNSRKGLPIEIYIPLAKNHVTAESLSDTEKSPVAGTSLSTIDHATTEVDTELLIIEVEKRPAIWNIASSEYWNRIIKKKAWEEVVLVFSETEDREDKRKLGLELQNKWRNIQDNYMKEFKTMEQLKSGLTDHMKLSYLYFRLQFLKQNMKKNFTNSNFKTDIGNNENPEIENLNQKSSSKTPKEENDISNHEQEKKISNSFQLRIRIMAEIYIFVYLYIKKFKNYLRTSV